MRHLRLLFLLILVFVGIKMCASNNCDTIPTQQLNEIIIKSNKPHIKDENGILVVNLTEIVKDKPVSNILEALGYMPGVTNNNGMIWLTGASNVTIIVNGELTNMPLQNLYQLLYTTPVDRLKNVEIMYSAPAKYHVNGAVINVVLNSPKPLDGLQGQLRTGYNQAHYCSYGGALSATYAIKDWTFDLNYGLSRTKSWGHEHTFSNHLLNGTYTMIEDDMHRIGNNWANTIYTSMGWKSLKLTYNGQIVSDSKIRSLYVGSLGRFNNNYNFEPPINYHNIALRYETPIGMTVGGDYTYYNENREQFLSQNFTDLLNSTNSQIINRFHLYVDQEHLLKKWKLNYGVEYQRSIDHSLQVYQSVEMGKFKNTLNEDVVSVYVGTERSFDWGLSFNISSKGEFCHNNYQNNWSFIPQLGVTYHKNPKSIFQVNLSSQRIYPLYWELHGGTNYINNYIVSIGNTSLLPYVNYSTQFNYIFKQKYVATLYFQYDDKATVWLPYQSPNTQNLIYQTINMNYKRLVGINLHCPFNIGDVWNVTTTANFFNQREKASHFHDISFDNDKWIFYGKFNSSLKFSKNSPISLSVDFSYISPSLQGIANMSSMWKADAGAKWLFGRKLCCELDLKVDDIFNQWSPTMTINDKGQDYKMKVFDMTSNLKLTFIWRFNGFKPKDYSIDTSRFGTGK